MSKNKVWAFKYEDDMIRCWDQEADGGRGEHYRIAKNKNVLFQNCPVEYDNSTRKCYIYSDVEIPGLELVGTNEIKQKNRGTKEEFDAMPVSIKGVEV